MTILTERHSQWKFYSKLHKCGELTVSADGRFFGLNCSKCKTIFTKLEEFIRHNQAKHVNEVEQTYTNHIEENYKKCEHTTGSKEINELAWQQLPELGDLGCLSSLYPIESDELERESKTITPHVTIEAATHGKINDNVNCGFKIDSDTIKNIKNEGLLCDSMDTITDHKGNFSLEMVPDITVNENCQNSSAIDLLSIQNRSVLTVIIEFYQKHSVLWNVNHTDYWNTLEKHKLLQKLSIYVKEKYKMNLTLKNIAKSFAGLLTLYRNELSSDTNELQNHDDVAITTNLWCFHKFKFLQQTWKKSLQMLSNNQLIELCEIYEQYPILWNYELNYVEYTQNETQRKVHFDNFLKHTCTQLGLEITHSILLCYLSRMKNLYISDKRKRFECELSKRHFKPTYAEIYEKMQYIDNYIAPFRCEECEEILNSYDKFRKHIATHKGPITFECKICGKIFCRKTNLQIHMRRHIGYNPFKCTQCDRSYPHSSDLIIHQRIHTGEKPYVCHLCGKLYRSSSQLSRHLKMHNPETRHYECPHCPRRFILNEKLKNHINSHLKYREHICGVCGKGFFALQTLRQHEKLHSEAMNYSCDICSKKFKQLPAMHSHKKTHF